MRKKKSEFSVTATTTNVAPHGSNHTGSSNPAIGVGRMNTTGGRTSTTVPTISNGSSTTNPFEPRPRSRSGRMILAYATPFGNGSLINTNNNATSLFN
mmetsp:Transcript_43590/g.49451  ORF Transcript_43590/g.49451 Transcript_43590/m.49451 type:complete len:98 (-) Transcript_43590:645-938(-)|eukprot:CAMPEP_0194143466 /NCGR_PEP_ID=MMETSP0152-20130528/12639_1 /TAXON_ID=1049557 /ORGANISM="Thalassiothrix antarctica, Strain L6-D1" /LENGTH=97 /DNA_ID=CAMNT_0038842897 /DNA_START=590 /DNA_END=883 /DNA_ORIENTATION=+